MIDCGGTEQDPHRGFKFVSDEGPDSILTGVTIRNGYAPKETLPYSVVARSVGGGIFCQTSSPTVRNCVIRDSTAYFGGAICCDRSELQAMNCVLTGCRTEAVYTSRGSPTLLNCTIADNPGTGVDSDYTGDLRLKNCIVWGNGGHQIWGRCSVAYCDVQGGRAGAYAEYPYTLYWGPGNIDADPCFVDPSHGDYHLLPNSPCINAGNPGYRPKPGETDIDGQPRVMGGYVDIGADEFSFQRPLMEVSPIEFEFHADKGGANPQPQDLTICNLGPGTLNWQIVEGRTWLQVHPSSGQSKGEKDKVTLSVDPSGMDGGVYRCELTVSDAHAANSPQVVSVTLHLGWIGSGSVLSVPSEYSTIQSAIDDAQHGDTVVIAPGVYTGDGNRDLDFAGKSIMVCSTDPNDPDIIAATVIDCNGSEDDVHRGFYLEGCIHGTISGLTITNGCAEVGGGIYCKDGSYIISNCQIVGNATKGYGKMCETRDGGDGAGIYCQSSSLTVRDCAITDNETGNGSDSDSDGYSGGRGGNGGGIYCDGSSLVVHRCDVANNRTGEGGYGGHHPESGGDGGDGGGIYCTDSVLRIRDCNVTGNKAGDGGSVCEGYPGDGGDGAGIYAAATSSVEIYDSIVGTNETGNGGCDCYSCGDAGRGGGFYCDNSSSLTIRNCSISGNTTSQRADGGGVHCESMLTMTDSTVSGNTTTSVGCGGGIYCHSAVIQDSTISDNVTGRGESGELEGQDHDGGAGGGIHCVGSLELTRCVIRGNRTGPGDSWAYPTDGGNGGGISCDSAVISDCWILDNATGVGAHDWSRAGGHGGDGGGIYCSSATITNCLLAGNATGSGGVESHGTGGGGGDGGAVYCGWATISNCLMIRNTTGSGGVSWSDDGGPGGNGGGVYTTRGTISNCTVVDNVTGEGGTADRGGADGERGRGGGVYAGSQTVITDSIIWANSPEQVYGHDCNNVTYCDIADDTCVGRAGNISADPLFVAGPLGDYYLSQTAAGQAVDSPCVDAGSDLAVNLGLDKFTTRTDKVGDEGVVDMGYHYPETVADLNEDGAVDAVDLGILASQWRTAPNMPSADIAPAGGDGVVDEVDLAVLAHYWLWPQSW